MLVPLAVLKELKKKRRPTELRFLVWIILIHLVFGGCKPYVINAIHILLQLGLVKFFYCFDVMCS